MNDKIRTRVLILAGGQGSRFWPISRSKKPKQFLSIGATGETLIQATARRIKPICTDQDLWVITNADHRELVAQSIDNCKIITEPVGRNTAASIGLAALLLSVEDPEAVLVVLPADHAVSDQQKFISVMRKAVELASKKDLLVTIGVIPTFANTAYGYIQRGKKIEDNCYLVKRFFEKPNQDRANGYLEAGGYFWNSGMFAWRAKIILEAFRTYLPNLYESLMGIRDAIGTENEQKEIDRIFPELESISIDFGILEHANNCAVVEADAFGWNDVGSWDAWADYFEKDSKGNLLHGDALAIDSKNCIVHSQERLTAVVGADDLVVIDSGDAILVCPRDKVQDVRKIVEELKKLGRKELV